MLRMCTVYFLIFVLPKLIPESMEQSVGGKVFAEQWLQNYSCLVDTTSVAAHEKGKQSTLDYMAESLWFKVVNCITINRREGSLDSSLWYCVYLRCPDDLKPMEGRGAFFLWVSSWPGQQRCATHLDQQWLLGLWPWFLGQQHRLHISRRWLQQPGTLPTTLSRKL